MGPTPTRTLGMRLSCNFVNVYTIVYRVQYTYTCTRAHPQRTSTRGKTRVSDKSSRTSRRAERAARAAEGRLPRRGACRLLRDDPRVGPVEFKLYELSFCTSKEVLHDTCHNPLDRQSSALHAGYLFRHHTTLTQ